MMKSKMKGKTEQQKLISPSNHHHHHHNHNHHDYNDDEFFNKSLSIITGKSGISSSANNNKKNCKMIKSSSQSNRAWHMGTLMAELPLSPSSIHSPNESPNHPRYSCRPSTVFYSPRNQDLRSSYSFSDLKKQLPNSMNETSSYELSRITELLGGVNGGYEPSIDYNDCKFPVTAAVPDKRGPTTLKSGEFREAIPVTDEEGGEHRSHRRLKPYQEFLDEVENQRQTEEFDAMKKATYTHLIRKLTKKEEDIDEWELKHRSKAEAQLDKLERKLEKKRAEETQKVHKKLAETKLEAQKRKAKARRLVLKEMAKHCSQL